MIGLTYGEGQVATAGDIQAYITKLSKLGKAALEARIAKLKLKIKAYTRIQKSGKFAKAGKPGPKNAHQAAYALRGCQNALSWHEQALKGAGVATANEATAAATTTLTPKSFADSMENKRWRERCKGGDALIVMRDRRNRVGADYVDLAVEADIPESFEQSMTRADMRIRTALRHGGHGVRVMFNSKVPEVDVQVSRPSSKGASPFTSVKSIKLLPAMTDSQLLAAIAQVLKSTGFLQECVDADNAATSVSPHGKGRRSF